MKPILAPSVFYGLLAMISWGTNNFLVASLTRRFGAFKIAFLIQIFAIFPTLLLLPIFKEQLVFNYNLIFLSLIALTGSLAYISLLKGFQEGTVSLVVSLSAAWAIITAILSFIFLKEPVSALKLLGMAVAFTGIVLVSANFKEIRKEKRVKIYAGVKWASFAALAWGIEMFLLALFSRKLGWYSANLGLRFWNVIIFFLLAILLKQKFPVLLKKIPKLIWVIILIDVLALTAYNIGLVKGEPAVVSVIGSAVPLVTVILAAIFLKERILPLQKIGISLILAGVASLSLV